MPDNTPAAGGTVVPPATRVYVKPVLKVYGTVAAVTAALDMTGMADGGPNNTRT